jgi:hypothetical protein
MRRYNADHVVPAGRLRPKQPASEVNENPYSTDEKAGQMLTGWRFNLLAVIFFLAGVMVIIQLVRLQFSPERNEFVLQGEQ